VPNHETSTTIVEQTSDNCQVLAALAPGNVRELRNVIESMVVMDADGVLDVDDLTEDLQQAASSGKSNGHVGVDSLVGKSLEEIERHYIAETLDLADGNENGSSCPR
jgi:two-component system response regulator HydG